MEPLQGKTEGAQEPRKVYTGLERVAEFAKRHPGETLVTLAHHMDMAHMRTAYELTRKDGATGVDGQTAKEYAKNLDGNLALLLERAKSGTYRAPPVRRAYIPKGTGKEKRPIGIPTFEDKVLQRGVVMVLQALYEQDFLDCSYGFRPGRSPHQALEAIWHEVMHMGGCWIVEVDIRKFFDTLDHRQVRALVNVRMRDGVLDRLIGKWLHAGVMENGDLSYPTAGTPQGGVISPLLANIYLHYVLDAWFEEEIKPRLKGRAFLIRYADDFIMGFAVEEDARRVLGVLPKRFGRYGLTINESKTRQVDFRPPPTGGAGHFDFLGFTHHWGKSRQGREVVMRRTAKDRFKRALRAISNYCRKARHEEVPEQQKRLSSKLIGHYAYYGITHNKRRLARFWDLTKRLWRKWLDRRSQKHSMPWETFGRLLERYALPPPRIVHSYVVSPARP